MSWLRRVFCIPLVYLLLVTLFVLGTSLIHSHVPDAAAEASLPELVGDDDDDELEPTPDEKESCEADTNKHLICKTHPQDKEKKLSSNTSLDQYSDCMS